MRYLTLAAAVAATIFFGGQVANATSLFGNTTNNTDNSIHNSSSSNAAAGAAASAKSKNVNKNTNVNANTNVNTATGGNAVSVSKGGNAHQAQGQKQGQRQSAKTGDQSVSVGGDNVSYEAAASTAPLASINPTASCQVPVSAGVGLVGLSTGVGTSYTNEACVQGEQTRLVCEISGRPGYADEKGLCRAMLYDLEYVAKARAKMQAPAPVASAPAPAASFRSSPASFRSASE